MKHWRIKNKPRGWIIGAQWSFTVPQKLVVKGEEAEVRTFKVDARVVRVRVGVSPFMPWAEPWKGTERLAVEVHLKAGPVDETFYLDNDDGLTPMKLTVGHGNPALGFHQLPVDALVADPTIQVSYQCSLSGHGEHGPTYRCSWEDEDAA